MRNTVSLILLLVLVCVPKAFADSPLNELLRDAIEQNRRVAELTRAGRYHEAIPYAQKALEIWKAVLGEDHPNIVHRINSLAMIYEKVGEYAESESFYRRALSMREEAYGGDHPAVAESLTNLARVCRAQGKQGEAESLDRRAAGILEKVRANDGMRDLRRNPSLPRKERAP